MENAQRSATDHSEGDDFIQVLAMIAHSIRPTADLEFRLAPRGRPNAIGKDTLTRKSRPRQSRELAVFWPIQP
jgi:hypothetical protein